MNRATVWGSVLWGSVLFFCLLPVLYLAPQPDSSIYWMAGRAIAQGQMPYTALMDIKPPGIHLLYALPAALSESLNTAPTATWMLVQCFDLLLLVASALLVRRLSKRVLEDHLASLALLWFLVLHLNGQLASFAQVETWALPFFLLGWLLLPSFTKETTLSLKPLLWRYALCGLALGLAFICKPTSAVPIIGLLALTLWHHHRASQVIGAALIWLACFAIPTVLVVIWLKTNGAWDAYIEIQRLFVVPYIDSARDTAPKHALVWLFLASLFISAFPIPSVLTLLGCITKLHWKPQGKRLALAYLLAGLVALWVQNRLFQYHLKILLPLIAFAVTAGAAELARLLPLRERPKTAFLFALPLLYLLGTRGPAIIATPLYATGYLARPAWYQRVEPSPKLAHRFTSIEASAQWMSERSSPGDTLMVWGFAPQIYIWSNLTPAQRFVYMPPVAASYAPQKWKDEFLRGLQQKPPRFFVVVPNEDMKWHGVKAGTPAKALRQWKALNQWFFPNYQRVKVWPEFEVWERK